MMAANVQRNLYGLGISPLSLSNRDHMLPEEMLANKEVGLIAIASSDGKNIASAEYIARAKEHIRQFVQQCINENTIGKIYDISVDDHLVNTVIYTDNLFVNELVYECGLEKPTAFRFHVDADLFVRSTNTPIPADEIDFEVQFSLTKNNMSKNYIIKESLTELNSKAFALDFDNIGSSLTQNKYRITLNSFTVKVPENYNPQEQLIVIHNILFAII